MGDTFALFKPEKSAAKCSRTALAEEGIIFMAKAPRVEGSYFYHRESVLGGTRLKPKEVFFVIQCMKSDTFPINVDPVPLFIESNIAIRLPKHSKIQGCKNAEELKKVDAFWSKL